ncbi:MAG: helix-turn-helix transcriptional regulator [Bacteroidetes bacterium]|nr:helix-turn-helix transcriptional regulator [Bacteroidota bacterium]
MQELKQIGANIKKHRLRKGLTQLDLAASCGFEESSIGRLENGNTNPTIKTLLKISNALSIKLSDLVRIK